MICAYSASAKSINGTWATVGAVMKTFSISETIKLLIKTGRVSSYGVKDGYGFCSKFLRKECFGILFIFWAQSFVSPSCSPRGGLKGGVLFLLQHREGAGKELFDTYLLSNV